MGMFEDWEKDELMLARRQKSLQKKKDWKEMCAKLNKEEFGYARAAAIWLVGRMEKWSHQCHNAKGVWTEEEKERKIQDAFKVIEKAIKVERSEYDDKLTLSISIKGELIIKQWELLEKDESGRFNKTTSRKDILEGFIPSEWWQSWQSKGFEMIIKPKKKFVVAKKVGNSGVRQVSY